MKCLAARNLVRAIGATAIWTVRDRLSVFGSYTYEHYDAQDWRYDGVAPATISNLLALGIQPPHYSLSVLRIGLRYRF